MPQFLTVLSFDVYGFMSPKFGLSHFNDILIKGAHVHYGFTTGKRPFPGRYSASNLQCYSRSDRH